MVRGGGEREERSYKMIKFEFYRQKRIMRFEYEKIIHQVQFLSHVIKQLGFIL